MFDILSMLGNMGGGFEPKAYVPMLLIMLPIGLLSLLYGYRLYRLFIFLVGFVLGTIIINAFAELPIAILGGLVAGAVCCVLWYLGIFILGAAIGLLIALALGIHEQFVLIIFAGVFGMLAIAIRKLMIVISTSWFGANIVASVISAILNLQDVFAQFGMAVVLTVVGIICQYTVTSGKKKPQSSVSVAGAGDSENSNDPPAQDVQSSTVTDGNS